MTPRFLSRSSSLSFYCHFQPKLLSRTVFIQLQIAYAPSFLCMQTIRRLYSTPLLYHVSRLLFAWYFILFYSTTIFHHHNTTTFIYQPHHHAGWCGIFLCKRKICSFSINFDTIYMPRPTSRERMCS